MKKSFVGPVLATIATTVVLNSGGIQAVEKTGWDQNAPSIYKFTSEETLFDLKTPELAKQLNKSNINIQRDGSLTVGDSTQVPHAYEGATKYGIFTSNAIESPKTFQSVAINLQKTQDPKDLVLVEASVSMDGKVWSGWLQAKNGSNEIMFYKESKYVKYRITIISYSPKSQTVIKGVTVKARGISKSRALAYANQRTYSVPTLKSDKFKSRPIPSASKPQMTANTVANPYQDYCFATDEGLVGSTTADGHVIHATDKFVALPDRQALDQSVTVSANGHTFTVPVWDLGPINQNDDFWDVNYTYPYPNEPVSVRDTTGYDGWGDIPRGTGETYYSAIDGFHNGWTSSHVIGGSMTYYVSDSNPGTQLNNVLSNPNYPSIQEKNNGAEIDLSDGLWNALGMTDNGDVTVTFNWVSQ